MIAKKSIELYHGRVGGDGFFSLPSKYINLKRLFLFSGLGQFYLTQRQMTMKKIIQELYENTFKRDMGNFQSMLLRIKG